MVNLKKLLDHYFYRDRADVSRAGLRKVGKSDDATRDFVKVYEQIRCHLGKAGRENEAHRDDVSEKLTINLRLYCEPHLDIQPNDLLDISHEGQQMKLIAGVVFKFPNHTEIEVFRRLEAGQK